MLFRSRKLIGTVKNVASRELLYAASSDNETFDRRSGALRRHPNVMTAILKESENMACARETSATEPIL